MKRYYTKTFVTFLFAFLGIVAVGFGIAVLASRGEAPAPVDNVADPR